MVVADADHGQSKAKAAKWHERVVRKAERIDDSPGKGRCRSCRLDSEETRLCDNSLDSTKHRRGVRTGHKIRSSQEGVGSSPIFGNRMAGSRRRGASRALQAARLTPDDHVDGGSFVNHYQVWERSITRLSLVPAPRYTDAMSDTATLETESEILEQVIRSDTVGLSPEAARALLGFRFNPAAVARMNELAEKNREGTIAPSERALLERYVRVGNFLNLIHAKARCALA
jgi:hypothetical protein